MSALPSVIFFCSYLFLIPALLLSTATSVQGIAPDVFPIPSFQEETPHIDGAFNEWSLFHIERDGDPQQGFRAGKWENLANYRRLILDGEDSGIWKRPSSAETSFQIINNNPKKIYLFARNRLRMTALTVKISESGTYGWRGVVKRHSAGSQFQSSALILRVGKFNKFEEWTELTSEISVIESDEINLSEIEDLQAFKGEAGDQLMLIVDCGASADKVTANFAPEPGNEVRLEKLSHNRGEILPIPWISPATGNPWTSAEGEWGAYQIDNNSGGSSHRNFLNYQPMSWEADKWKGHNVVVGDHPSFSHSDQKYTLSSGYNLRSSAIVFSPSRAGEYSWTGKVLCSEAHGWSAPSMLTFGKFDSAGQWFGLFETLVEKNQRLDLNEVDTIQRIFLGSGEKLALILHSTASSSNNRATFEQNSDNKVGLFRIDSKGVIPNLMENPQLSKNLDRWGVYQIGYDGSGDEVDWDNYVPMSWNEGSQKWVGENLIWGGPSFSPALQGTLPLLTTGPETGAKRPAALAFTPSKSGLYAITGTILTADTGSYNKNTLIRIGKFDVDKQWSPILELIGADNALTDLNQFEELRQIELGIGESLVFINIPAHRGSNSIHFQSDEQNPFSINLVSRKSGIPWWKPKSAIPSERTDPNSANPHIDHLGHSWAVYQVMDGPLSDLSSYQKMIWNDALSRWEGTSLGSGHPYFSESGQSLRITCERHPAKGSKISALMVTPSSGGTFSWTGSLFYNYASSSGSATVRFGKFDTAGAYSELGTVIVDKQPGNPVSAVDLDLTDDPVTAVLPDYSFLRNIKLNLGDRLVVSFHSAYGAANNFFLRHENEGLILSRAEQINPSLEGAGFTHVVDVNASIGNFDRRLLGQVYDRNFTNELFTPGALVRGPAQTGESYNWKKGSGRVGEVDEFGITVLDFLLDMRDTEAIPLITVNSIGTQDINLDYKTERKPELVAQHASDYVRYCNYIIHAYSQADLDQNRIVGDDLRILNSIEWEPKLLKQNEQRPPLVKYWEIGNEPAVWSNANKPPGKESMTDWPGNQEPLIPDSSWKPQYSFYVPRPGTWSGFNPPREPLWYKDNPDSDLHWYQNHYRKIASIIKATQQGIRDNSSLPALIEHTVNVGPCISDLNYTSSQNPYGIRYNHPLRLVIEDHPVSPIDFISVHPYDDLGYKYTNDKHNNDALSLELRTLRANGKRKALNEASRIRTFIEEYSPKYAAGTGDSDTEVLTPSLLPSEVEIFASEYDPINFIETVRGQNSMYGVLAAAETIFLLRDGGYDGACHWWDDYRRYDLGNRIKKTPFVPVADKVLYEAFNSYIGDQLLYKHAPFSRIVGNNNDPVSVSSDNLRLYVTRCNQSDDIYLWALNFSGDEDLVTSISLRGLQDSPDGFTVHRRVLGNLHGRTKLQTENLGRESSDNRYADDHYKVDIGWRSEQLDSIDLTDFQVPIPAASVVLIIVSK